MRANPEEEWSQTARALDWDRANPPQYDRRWLALHGVRAVRSAMAAQQGAPDGIDEITVAQSKWAAMDEENRKAMLEVARRHRDGTPPGAAPAAGSP